MHPTSWPLPPLFSSLYGIFLGQTKFSHGPFSVSCAKLQHYIKQDSMKVLFWFHSQIKKLFKLKVKMRLEETKVGTTGGGKAWHGRDCTPLSPSAWLLFFSVRSFSYLLPRFLARDVIIKSHHPSALVPITPFMPNLRVYCTKERSDSFSAHRSCVFVEWRENDASLGLRKR